MFLFLAPFEEKTMRKHLLALPIVAAFAATPAFANDTPVAPWELGQFIGAPLHGAGFMPLGIVSGYDTDRGIIQVVSPNGGVATIHTSMLVADSRSQLQAPLLNKGDIAAVSTLSTSDIPFVAPSITVEDPAYYGPQ